MKTAVLSAGHGGRDPGAVANGVQEKDVTLAICLKTRAILDCDYTGARLVLPRDNDRFVSLNARRDLTARVNADIYVSMHANWFGDPSVGGFESFLHDGPLYEVTEEYRDYIHDELLNPIRKLSIHNRGKKFANHDVTRMMPCPTILLEYGFVSNPREAKLLSNPEVQTLLARHTAIGIASALKLEKKEAVKPGPYWVTAGTANSFDMITNILADLNRATPSVNPFISYAKKPPNPVFIVVADELERLDHAKALSANLKDRGFASQIITARPEMRINGGQSPSPPQPIIRPEVIRPVEIRIEEVPTNHEAWLLKDDEGRFGSFGRLHAILDELGYEVEGRGSYLNIRKRR